MSFGSSLFSPPPHVVYRRKRNRTSRFKVTAANNVPDFLSADWFESRKKKPIGPRLD
ncbi:NAD(P)H-quinone oxidoreductase subunit H, partial [Trifolium medium]|nr:NAD(P)H-quinone oxidoreductase subunit H [Trifolium medium]